MTGGNTKTLMVACLSPADNNYDETLSTLRYANRAKNIKNKPKINEDPKDALLRQYQEEINNLKAMLMGQMPIPAGGFEGEFLLDSPRGGRESSLVTRGRLFRLELSSTVRKFSSPAVHAENGAQPKWARNQWKTVSITCIAFYA